jgi:hypothetical protein
MLANGTRVDSAKAWRDLRRPQLLELYETDIYGRIPANTPKVTWTVGDLDKSARDGAAFLEFLVKYFKKGYRPPSARTTAGSRP